MNTIAVILARGGSKGVPRRILKHDGRQAAYRLDDRGRLGEQSVHSPCGQYRLRGDRSSAKEYGASVPFMRPDELAEDHVWSRDALKHAVLASEEHYGVTYDYVVELPCVAPLRTSEHIIEAVD
jgi:CMP-N-acetylneuraminic acid synthetase